MTRLLSILIIILLQLSCSQKKSDIPTVAFIDAFQDNTIAMAKQGFFDALKQNGFDEKNGTLKVIYRNAQGDIPTLTQIAKYMIAQQPDLIATCPSISTVTVAQNTDSIPVCMMVSSNPKLMNFNGGKGYMPNNLLGTFEDIDYIDTSFGLIPQLMKPKADRLVVGMIFNQSEPQSVMAMEDIKNISKRDKIDLIALPVNSSAEVLLITQTLLSKNIDAFFANPDNTVFASFESIVNACNKGNVPIFTSEAGLVSRGALVAYGADMYQWGHQAGRQASEFLKTGKMENLHPEKVIVRKRVYNKTMADKYHIVFPADYIPMP